MICGSCGTPMKCIDMSVPVVYNNAVVYFGSEFACPCCKISVTAITGEQSIDVHNFTPTNNTIEVTD
jgi:hypothetical protein